MVSSLIFQKFSGEGLTEPPPQTPPPLFLGLRPRFGLRPQFSGALRPRLGLLPRYSGASRPRFGLRPQLSIGDLGLAPKNKFLDWPLSLYGASGAVAPPELPKVTFPICPDLLKNSKAVCRRGGGK